ncbi:MAG: hypothetical protein MRZ66_00230 [Clostridiales bacterium]|nr:hypothetical protein [Clostridiales bacterium]
MLNLTKQQTIAEHRKMWHWIADETKKQGRKVEKEEYFKAMNIPSENRPELDCYCCEYAGRECLECPVEWDGDYGVCCDRHTCGDWEGLYAQWANTNDPEESAQLARKIAEQPERR